MAMGKRASEQTPMWVAATDLPVSPSHPFYVRLNRILRRRAVTDGFARVDVCPEPPELRPLRAWLGSWTGIGAIEIGMAR